MGSPCGTGECLARQQFFAARRRSFPRNLQTPPRTRSRNTTHAGSGQQNSQPSAQAAANDFLHGRNLRIGLSGMNDVLYTIATNSHSCVICRSETLKRIDHAS